MQKINLFLDLNNLCIRALFADASMIKNPNPDFSQHKHVVLNMIFSNINKFSPDEVICAIDDRNNWRKKVYPEYKQHRKESRDKDVFPWEVYFAYINDFIEELKEIFPFKFLQTPFAEADDVIAVLVRHLTTTDNVIVTTDSDYIQLLQEKNVRLWNPLKKCFIVDKEPHKTLHVKIISGDPGDGVPGIKKRVGEKTAIKLIDSGELENLLKEEEYKKAYDRNKRLIDWCYIPDALKKETLKRYDNYTCINNFDTLKIMKFFVKHGLREHLENLAKIKLNLKPLTETTGIKEFI